MPSRKSIVMTAAAAAAAAVAAKSHQLCPTLCHPIDGSPPGSPFPGIPPGKNTGVSCYFLLQCTKVKSESEVTQWCWLLATPCTAAYQAPLFMGFSRQGYRSGVPLPPLIATTRQVFAGKVMSLLLNSLSGFVIAFLPMSKCLLISWLQSPSSVI